MSTRPRCAPNCAQDCCAPPRRGGAIDNLPFLAAIRRRIGAHRELLARMQADLDTRDPALAALSRLTTRRDGDPTLALLDAWALVGDVLTFYQERIANEAYLGTARDAGSLRRLSLLVDYRPTPTIAASTALSFKLDQEDASKRPVRTRIRRGSKVQSVPRAGELPVVFETNADLDARTEWNTLTPASRTVGETPDDAKTITVAPGAAPLRPVEPVVIVWSGAGEARIVVEVVNVGDGLQAEARLSFAAGVRSDVLPSDGDPSSVPRAPLTKSLVEAHIAPYRWSAPELRALAEARGWDVGALETLLDAWAAARGRGDLEVHALRSSSGVFGAAAPPETFLPDTMKEQWAANWNGATVGTIRAALKLGQNALALDGVVPGVVGKSWAVVTQAGGIVSTHEVTSAYERTLSYGGLVARATVLELDGSACSGAEPATVRVWLRSEALRVLPNTAHPAIEGDRIVLERCQLGLELGRRIVISGEPLSTPGLPRAFAARITRIDVERGRTVLAVSPSLPEPLVRAKTTIAANVVEASHGETTGVAASVGSVADPVTVVLTQGPLTHLRSPDRVEASPAVEVRVDGLTYDRADDLEALPPHARSYVLEPSRDATGMRVRFGAHAGLPSVGSTIEIGYRRGAGASGNVDSARLTQALDRPAGLADVTNPVPAVGGQDAESERELRRNAPLHTRILDRLVSVSDYEDFARAYPGVAKAHARWAWDGFRRYVSVSVAAIGGGAVPAGSELAASLSTALTRAGERTVVVRLSSYARVGVAITARVVRDPAIDAVRARLAVLEALRAAFGFEARELGASLSESQVLAVVAGARGIRTIKSLTLSAPGRTVQQGWLRASASQNADHQVPSTELLVFDEAASSVEVIG